MALSAKAREEQKHEAVQFAVMRSRRDAAKLNKLAWDAAEAREASKLGVELVDTKRMPDDPALIAIQGPRTERREARRNRIWRPGFRPGGSCRFSHRARWPYGSGYARGL